MWTLNTVVFKQLFDLKFVGEYLSDFPFPNYKTKSTEFKTNFVKPVTFIQGKKKGKIITHINIKLVKYNTACGKIP